MYYTFPSANAVSTAVGLFDDSGKLAERLSGNKMRMDSVRAIVFDVLKDRGFYAQWGAFLALHNIAKYDANMTEATHQSYPVCTGNHFDHFCVETF